MMTGTHTSPVQNHRALSLFHCGCVYDLCQAERELAAREAFLRLEAYKTAGVYAVLKRIQVWQARSGKRLSDAFHGGAGEHPDLLSAWPGRRLLWSTRVPRLQQWHFSACNCFVPIAVPSRSNRITA